MSVRADCQLIEFVTQSTDETWESGSTILSKCSPSIGGRSSAKNAERTAPRCRPIE
jgi:hypothetical protein